MGSGFPSGALDRHGRRDHALNWYERKGRSGRRARERVDLGSQQIIAGCSRLPVAGYCAGHVAGETMTTASSHATHEIAILRAG
jgi:hypothetical protein